MVTYTSWTVSLQDMCLFFIIPLNHLPSSLNFDLDEQMKVTTTKYSKSNLAQQLGEKRQVKTPRKTISQFSNKGNILYNIIFLSDLKGNKLSKS